MPGVNWARNFSVTSDDIDHIVGYLLETETPLTVEELAHQIVQNRLRAEATALTEKYKNVRVYNPALTYTVGQQVSFPLFNFAIGAVENVRSGHNPSLGAFDVIAVKFEYESTRREFAANYRDHVLNTPAETDLDSMHAPMVTVDEVFAHDAYVIIDQVEEKLRKQPDLANLAGLWFPRDLILPLNQGHLNLAEAILDINQGGPASTEQIMEDIGGLGASPRALQIFSLNMALSQDTRFDEVGPSGKVMWYLRHKEPQEVLNTPAVLRYSPIEYDSALLSPEMMSLEHEIDDEWSDLESYITHTDAVMITLNYPHRRAGTLPLNAKMRHVFPSARRTPRIALTLVDGQDGEEFMGWVVRQDRYVFGLAKMYKKHKLPVGATVVVRRSPEAGKIIVDFKSHRARTEYVPLIVPKDNRIAFDFQKRSIGAEYDELMILGADDLDAVDELAKQTAQSRRTLHAILVSLMTELSRQTPQGTIHGKTLYSAVNVVRRCPPAPIFATLAGSTEFEHVNHNIWRLSSGRT
jgi:hypothetical protein